MVEEQQYIVRVRLPRGKELLGIVESKLAGNKLKVRCSDKKYRICRIPGRIKKYVWIKDDDIMYRQASPHDKVTQADLNALLFIYGKDGYQLPNNYNKTYSPEH